MPEFRELTIDNQLTRNRFAMLALLLPETWILHMRERERVRAGVLVPSVACLLTRSVRGVHPKVSVVIGGVGQHSRRWRTFWPMPRRSLRFFSRLNAACDVRAALTRVGRWVRSPTLSVPLELIKQGGRGVHGTVPPA